MNSHRPKTKRTIAKRFDLHNKQLTHSLHKNVELVKTDIKKKAMAVKVVGEYGMLKVETPKSKQSTITKAYGEYGLVRVEGVSGTVSKFDASIIISSFDRYDSVNNMLTQLYNQVTKYTFRVIILNDGSSDERYLKLTSTHPNIILLNNTENNGKKKYWKSINTLFEEVLKVRTKVVVQIDDDYILCDNFLNILLDKYFEIKQIDPNYMAVALHRTHDFIPSQWGMGKNWVDGGTLFDYNFIDAVKKINEVSPARWKYDESLSSGVWYQISALLKNNNYQVYRFDFSLVKHGGNYDSKMNKTQRDASPITTWNFLNDIKHE